MKNKMKRKSYWLQRSFTPNQMVDTLIAACQWDLGACGGDGPKETLYPPCRLKLKRICNRKKRKDSCY